MVTVRVRVSVRGDADLRPPLAQLLDEAWSGSGLGLGLALKLGLGLGLGLANTNS